ncbi:MAG: hypothetical protein JKY50_13150 [Oleispira sp.]|nr:hypothetical protein [Oleispira sp.]MBL4880356.1 hypothetical protein [Oleispira sp.]
MTFTVAVISDNTTKLQYSDDGLQLISLDVNDISASQNLNRDISAFIIDTKNAALAHSWVIAIRGDAEYFSHLLYLHHFSHILTDVNVPKSSADLLQQLNDWSQRKAQLRLSDSSQLNHQVIQYLWLNKSRCITVKKSLKKEKGFYYPLLDLWSDVDTAGKLAWLGKQCNAGFLQKVKLINRTRSCKQCDSAMLNFIDTCPSCKSIDILTEQALHCFTCGHIAKEQTFQRDNRISCPNCLTQLRHIGTDYDRPIENIRCNSCNNLSINSEARAQCFSCEEDNDIDRLFINNFYQYQLAINGLTLAQSGSLDAPLPVDLRESVSKEHMAWLLNWLIHTPTADETQFHRLIKIRIVNYQQLLQEKSELLAEQLLSDFRQRLAILIGDQNTFCDMASDVWLYAFPFTSELALDEFKQQLLNIAEDAVDNALEISVVEYDLVEKKEEGEMLSWINRIIEQQ